MKNDLIASMHRVDDAAQGAPGLIQIGAWKDQISDRLVGLALWESQEAFEASADYIFQAIAGDPFDQWRQSPGLDPEYWTLGLIRFDGHVWCVGQAAKAVSYSAGLR
ncbi:hypothetical protein [Streptomyces sp. NBC_00233]|uniref:hypothetical protein n=1 Tax=Streptomyces sp. NBC_00233 TaxID=2975686 RepID=UPI002259BD65|nr:hypothetical protein [Streptomyces sp. NBC_00233]MCX5233455.1 hypothetical protein [Streptomyces sp. NBC_00233]